MGCFETKTVTIKIVSVDYFTSFLTGEVITEVIFYDGKTKRSKEFRGYRDFFNGEKIKVEKIGSGKYAGYRF